MVEWFARLTCREGSVAKVKDVDSNPMHHGGQFGPHVWFTVSLRAVLEQGGLLVLVHKVLAVEKGV